MLVELTPGRGQKFWTCLVGQILHQGTECKGTEEGRVIGPVHVDQDVLGLPLNLLFVHGHGHLTGPNNTTLGCLIHFGSGAELVHVNVDGVAEESFTDGETEAADGLRCGGPEIWEEKSRI